MESKVLPGTSSPSTARKWKLFYGVIFVAVLIMIFILSNNYVYKTVDFVHIHRSMSRMYISQKTPSVSRNSTASWHRFLPADGNCLPNYFLQNRSGLPKEKYKKAVIGFQHLNKAGGMTVRGCIRSLRQRNRVDYLISSPQRLEAEIHVDFGTLTADDIDVYHGDYFFGMCERLQESKTNRSCTYFTVLRDPYERVISSYYYCKGANYDQTCGPYFRDQFTVEEWAVAQGSYFFNQLLQRPEYCKMGDPSENEFFQVLKDNLPTSGLFGFPHQCWFLQKTILDNMLTQDDRNKILDYLVLNLENIFAVIGLTDRMFETLSLLQEAYGIPFTKCAGTHNNRGSKPSDRVEMREKLLGNPGVNNALREDVVLYKKAVEIFELESARLRNIR